jgi:hypothetical protein
VSAFSPQKHVLSRIESRQSAKWPYSGSACAVPRFVVLYHDAPPGYERPPHFDLMLEAGSALRTFALPRWPSAGEAIACEALADHRLAYLDYEGPLSGGRGEVTRHEAGEYSVETESGETLVIRLHGQRLSGTLTLRRLSPDSAEWEAAWQAGSTVDP